MQSSATYTLIDSGRQESVDSLELEKLQEKPRWSDWPGLKKLEERRLISVRAAWLLVVANIAILSLLATFTSLPGSLHARATPREAVTVLLTGPRYLLPTLVLGQSLLQHSPHRDRLILTPYWSAFEQSHFDMLHAAGWQIREIEHIAVTQDAKHPVTYFKDVMCKLTIWNMTEYDAVALIDADAMVVGSLDEPFQLLHDTKYPLAAVHNIPGWNHDPKKLEIDATLNAGVLFARPDAELFADLVEASHDISKYDNTLPEQAFLSKYFSGRWLGLNLGFNLCPEADGDGRSKFYQTVRKNASILHYYGDMKPWQVCMKGYSTWRCTPDAFLWMRTMRDTLTKLNIEPSVFEPLGWKMKDIFALIQ